MAALCPGVQYGLSSQENLGENKDLIFVKLTDSALRAIEEYIKNQNKCFQSPTIKFLGNEGVLCFPSSDDSASFKFSLSSTADMEGPGGSFECVQQTSVPRNSLGVLGPVPYKMRIHANDDVYEATRHRMTVAEENHKNKCTREIKPNQTDIGRKVKVKQSRASIVPPTARRETPPLRDSMIKPSYQSNNSSSSASASAAASSLKPLMGNHLTTTTNNTNNNNNNNSSSSLSNGLGSNHVSSSRPIQNKPLVPDIARRPIKERLIHLLALRPFKKPELYERLNREGLREKNSMTSVLKQISCLKDNSYHLNRAMWNDVNENWPFYTEQERQMLKRRKPQNLTPPGSSDGGSSGSGQSPTSTHPGSPPPPVSSSKRPGYYDGADGLPTKRQRISHYRKPSESTYRLPAENNTNQRRPVTDSRDTSNMNPRSRESPTNGYYNGMLNNDKRNLSDDEDNANRKRSCDSHSLSFGFSRENGRSQSPAKLSGNPETGGRESPRDRNGIVQNGRTKQPFQQQQPQQLLQQQQKEQVQLLQQQQQQQQQQLLQQQQQQQQQLPQDDDVRNGGGGGGGGGTRYSSGKMSLSSVQNSRLARVSPDSQSDRIAASDSGPPPSGDHDELDSHSEFPDYISEYTPIQSLEQRRRYKADFNADYAEYRELHGVVEKVSRRFAELKERLKQEDQSSPRYKDIKKLIVREYEANKQDSEHQKATRRFQYLHDKLSHIKRLVLEYDHKY